MKNPPKTPPSLFIQAFENNDIEQVKWLVNQGKNLNAVSGVIKCTPLMIAVRFGLIEAVDILLTAGAEVNAVDRDGSNALFYVTEQTSPQIIDFLVKHGIDLNKRSRFNTMAIHAVALEQLEIAVMLIISAGTDLSLDNKCQLLMGAMDNGHVRMFQMLLALGAPMGCKVLLEMACSQTDGVYVQALRKNKAPFSEQMLKHCPHKFAALNIPIQIK